MVQASAASVVQAMPWPFRRPLNQTRAEPASSSAAAPMVYIPPGSEAPGGGQISSRIEVWI